MGKNKKTRNYERKRRQILTEYNDMRSEVNENGIKKYTSEYIYDTLADKYFMTPRRIYQIIHEKS